MTKFRARFEHGSAVSGGDFALSGVQPQYAPDLPVEPKHLDLHLAVHLDERSVDGRADWTVLSRRSDAQSLKLNAVDLDIHGVTDTSGAEVSWRIDGEQLEIHWITPIPSGEERTITIEWTVTSPKAGLYFGKPPSEPNEALSWMATDHETERARYWLPCIDEPNVRTTLDVRLTSATDHVRLGPGFLVGEEAHSDGTTTSHWKLEERCPSYLLCIVVGDFVRADGGEFDGIPIAFFAPKPYTAADLDRSFGPTADMMRWMVGRLKVPFPFPKYFQFAVPGIGGAMENITLTSWDDSWVCDALFHEENGWLVDLINLHEMAHSYFGDAVVCRDYAHAWLKEGWATYMESVWLGDTGGDDELHYQMAEESRLYRDEADHHYNRAIVTRNFNSSWMMYDRHLYPGAAWRVHMLRCILGESDFWNGVTEYLTRYSGKVVETDDFRHVLEEVSGRSLARFFDQWLHSPGYPKLAVKTNHSQSDGTLTVNIEQTQESPANTPAEKRVGLFHFPLEIGLQDGDGMWRYHQVDVDKKCHTVVFTCAEKPIQIVVDPFTKLLHELTFDPGIEMLAETLTECPHISGRLHAAKTLAHLGKHRGVEALKAAYSAEPHWGVRTHLARHLGSVGTSQAADALANLLDVECDARAMRALVTACGEYRSTMMANRLSAWIREPGRPYWALGSALRSLGQQRNKADLSLLTEHLNDRGWWGWVRRDAQVALGLTRQEEAFTTLLEHAEADEPYPQVRQLLPIAIAEAAKWLDRGQQDRAREAIEDLIEPTAVRSVQMGAVALAQLKATPSIAKLLSWKAQLPAQFQPGLQKTINRFKSSDAGSATLQKSLEDLTETVAALRGQVADLEAKQSVKSVD